MFKCYKDIPGVVFLVDPPYLSTEAGTYRMSWRLADYLDVLTILKGHSFVYFTSERAFVRIKQGLHFRTVRLDGPKLIRWQPVQGMQESGV